MSSKIEIYVSCAKLKNMDVTSKSDPCCVMYIEEDDEWKEVGRTETIQNNLNPQFTRPFEVTYKFDEEQKVRFEVYDIDNKTEKLTDDDAQGQIETTIAEIVSGNPLTKPLILKGKKDKEKLAGGTITLRVQELGTHDEVLQMTFGAKKLDNMDKFGKSDPFLQFSRKTADDGWQVVCKTEVIKNNLNPTWRPLRVKISQLCGGHRDLPVKVDVIDFDDNGKHDLIGSFTTSVGELIRAKGHEWPIINPAKQKKKKYENSGVVILASSEVLKD